MFKWRFCQIGFNRWKLFNQGLIMLVLGTRSCFKLRIIIAERRYEYLFVTNIFGHLFTFSKKTISHGFCFSGGHVTVIFRITVGGFCVLGKFIVTLFRVVFVFNCCLFSVWVFIASPVVLEASLPIGHKKLRLLSIIDNTSHWWLAWIIVCVL